MRRTVSLLLCAALLLSLSGCAGFYANEYLSVQEHNDPFAYRESETEPTEEPLPTASSYYSLRAILLRFVNQGVEHGQVRLTAYEGDVEQDLRRVTHYLTAEDPVGAYATDYITVEREPDGEDWLLTVDAVYRRSVSEIEAIRPVRGNEAAKTMMLDALTQLQSSVTVRISGYLEEDFVSELRSYALENPDVVIELPQLTVATYPEEGNVRIVEVHFVYEGEKETLRAKRPEVEAVLSSAVSYMRYARTEREKVELLYSYLSSRFHYREDRENATVYSMLCQGVGDSVSWASVVQWLSRRAGLDCYLVEGSRDGEPWCWNLICVDGVWRHFDLQADCLADRPVTDRDDEQMEGYEWDREAYPVISDQGSGSG